MVKVGFICEGETEKLVVESFQFQQFLQQNNIELVQPVIDAKGAGNLLPQNIEQFVEILDNAGSTIIFMLTDLDEDKCVTLTKERIQPKENQVVIVSIKEIESWFLADSSTLSKIFQQENYFFENPETVNNPFKKLSLEFAKFQLTIPASKLKLAYKMLGKGFTIENAASHPNCSSAKYFLEKIQLLNTNQ